MPQLLGKFRFTGYRITRSNPLTAKAEKYHFNIPPTEVGGKKNIAPAFKPGVPKENGRL
jgi:hypothetical protein